MPRVATVQMKLESCSGEKSFRKKVEPFVRKAADAGARLVVFPEDCGGCLVGLYMRPWRNLGAMLTERNILKDIWDRRSFSLECHLFSWVHPAAQRIFEEVFSSLATSYRINIMAGSIMLPEGDRVRNRAYMYGADGRLLATQDKIHLYLTEVQWGCGSGDTIELIHTEVGPLGILICMDTGYPEMGRILANRGAEILLDGTANPDECFDYEDLNGLWARVQDTGIYGIKSCLFGDVPGKLKIRGKSAIYAPFELTPDRSGILARTETADREELLVADIDLDAIRATREERAARRNSSVIARYLPEMYNMVTA